MDVDTVYTLLDVIIFVAGVTFWGFVLFSRRESTWTEEEEARLDAE